MRRSLLSRLASSLVLPLASGALAAVAASAEPPADALVAEIPFDPRSPAGRVTIDLAPEGQKPFVLELDTGATDSIVTPRVARALGISIRKLKSSPYRKKTRLGRDLQFWVDDSVSDTGARFREYGLLGAEFLDDYVLEIDYPGRTVRFYDPEKYGVPEAAVEPGTAVLPFRRNGTRVLAEIEIDGRTILALVDTGTPAVIVSGRELKRAGIDWKGLPELPGVVGVTGPVQAHTYPARKLRFAGFEFAEQPITIAPRGLYNMVGPDGSVVGYDVLSRFVLRIDYERRRLWLKDGGQHVKTYWAAAPEQLTDAPAERRPTDEEIRESDARWRAEQEARRATRLYAETAPGRFVVIDGYRLRLGPQKGEVWYTHEEMLARRKEVEEAGEQGVDRLPVP